MPLSKIDSDSLNTPITAVNLSYTGTLTGGTGVVNLGSGQVYKDASGNVGVGTSSPAAKLDVQTSAGRFQVLPSGGSSISLYAADGGNIGLDSAGGITLFKQNGTERARIDSSGNLLVGTTTVDARLTVLDANNWVISSKRTGTGGEGHIRFDNANGYCGAITTSGSSTAYNTSSDYRLKEAIAPMTGALAKVAALRPCTYKWKVDGSDGQGFIAHELAEVEAGCVTGEKDAVDADGNPQYQGIDTSFLVATLAAAIQELKAIVDAQGAEIAALKGTP